MLKKVITKSGLRILKAIKKLSTKRNKSSKKASQTTNVSKFQLEKSSWFSTGLDHEAVSLSWSLASLDTKSVDTYLTVVSVENALEIPEDCYTCNDERKYCCCCLEYEENQRNENKENEMFV